MIITTEGGFINEIIDYSSMTVHGSVEIFVKSVQNIVNDDRFAELSNDIKPKSDEYQLESVASNLRNLHEEIELVTWSSGRNLRLRVCSFHSSGSKFINPVEILSRRTAR